ASGDRVGVGADQQWPGCGRCPSTTSDEIARCINLHLQARACHLLREPGAGLPIPRREWTTRPARLIGVPKRTQPLPVREHAIRVDAHATGTRADTGLTNSPWPGRPVTFSPSYTTAPRTSVLVTRPRSVRLSKGDQPAFE